MLRQDLTSATMLHPFVARLIAEHGELISGPALAKLLGFSNRDAFRKAAARNTLPVQVFRLPHRRGQFASTLVVGRWLVDVLSLAEDDDGIEVRLEMRTNAAPHPDVPGK